MGHVWVPEVNAIGELQMYTPRATLLSMGTSGKTYGYMG